MNDVSSSNTTCASNERNSQNSPSRASPKCKRRRLLSDLMDEPGSVACGADQSSNNEVKASVDDSATAGSKSTDGTSKFFVRSNSDGFKCRQSSVFDTLNALEAKHKSDIAEWKATDFDRRQAHAEGDDDDEEEDASTPRSATLSPPSSDGAHFKVPIGLPLKRLNKGETAPADYTLHPDKWTKYTLADVNNDCMSENANSAAAIDFLSGKWKVGSDYDDDDGGCCDKAIDSSGVRSKHEYRMGRQSTSVAASGCVSAAADSSSNDADEPEDGANQTEPKIKCKPPVQLSFLNCTKHCDDVYGKSVDEDDEQMEKVTEANSDSDVTPSNTASPFRSIRKRHRSLRPINSVSRQVDEHN